MLLLLLLKTKLVNLETGDEVSPSIMQSHEFPLYVIHTPIDINIQLQHQQRTADFLTIPSPANSINPLPAALPRLTDATVATASPAVVSHAAPTVKIMKALSVESNHPSSSPPAAPPADSPSMPRTALNYPASPIAPPANAEPLPAVSARHSRTPHHTANTHNPSAGSKTTPGAPKWCTRCNKRFASGNALFAHLTFCRPSRTTPPADPPTSRKRKQPPEPTEPSTYSDLTTAPPSKLRRFTHHSPSVGAIAAVEFNGTTFYNTVPPEHEPELERAAALRAGMRM